MSRGTVFELNEMIAALERLKHAPEQIAALVRDELQAHLQRTVAAQTTAYGDPWKPSASGEPLLVNAAAAVRYAVSGNRLRVTLGGVEARHHFGAVRGGKARRVIPNRPYLPKPVQERVIARAQDIVDAALAGSSK